MSSILKALKKAEDQSGLGQENTAWSMPAGSTGRAGRFETLKRIFIPISIAAFVGLLVAFGIVFWMGAPGDTPASHTLAMQQNPAAARPADLPDASGKKSIEKQPSKKKQRLEASQPARAVPKPVAQAEHQAPASDPAINTVSKVAPAAQPPAAIPVDNPTPPAPAQPDSAAGARQPEPIAMNYDFRNDQRIEIQALVWAMVPEERFAVINNRVLHEGSWLDEIKIVTINKDDVLFSDTSGMWRERMRIR